MKKSSFVAPWLFVLPALTIALAFHVAPFIDTLVKSFTNFTPARGGVFVGLENYVALSTDEYFWRALTNTLLYMVVVVPCMVLLPLLLAMLAKPLIPGIGLFRASFYTPVVASMVAVGIIWQMLLREDGIINWLYSLVLPGWQSVSFLTDSTLFLFCCMAVTVWKGLGYYMVIYLAALANVPTSLLEAAAMDGAGVLRRFWTVVLPAIRPTMLLIALLSAIASMKVFAEVYVLGGGTTAGPGNAGLTMVYLIRQNMSGFDSHVGYASALSLTLFVLTIGLSVAYIRQSQKEETQ